MEEKQAIKQSKKISLSILQIIMISMSIIILSSFLTYQYVMTVENMTVDTQETTTLPKGLVEKLRLSYNILKKTYIDKIDDAKLVDGALSGFMSSLGDPYTVYENAADMKSLNELTDSSFEGVGIEIEPFGEYIRIVSPIDGSPASKAHLQSGDIIIGVDGEDTKGKTTTELSQKVRGPKGTTVKLKLKRGESIFEVSLVRDKIPLTSVKEEMVPNQAIGKIKISSFSQTTPNELEKAITDLRKNGAKSFIIDLRSNPGGLVDSVQKMINMFVDNDQVIFQMENRENGIHKVRSSQSLGQFKVSEPVMVLIDKGSASASEIFAAALSELNRAKLVGQTSFGKGVAQSIIPLDAETGVKVTSSKWLTPNGNWIHKKGITPNIEVTLPEYASLPLINVMELPKINDSSTSVLNIQKILRAIDYPALLTGTYDQNLQELITQLQQKNNLSKTGILDRSTADKINELLMTKVRENDTQLNKAIELLK